MKQKVEKLKWDDFKSIVRTRNVRLSDAKYDDYQHLIPSILDHGIELELYLQNTGNGSFPLVRGYLRHGALAYIIENDIQVQLGGPKGLDLLKAIQPKGLPVNMISNASIVEIAMLHVDHGNVRGLTSPAELQLAASMLLDAGMSEAEVANHLTGILDRMKPVPAPKALKLGKIREEEGFDAYFKAYAEYRRGVVQGLKDVWRSPKRVMDGIMVQATGCDSDGEELSKEQFEEWPKITGAVVTKLLKAHCEDVKDPNEKWNQLVTGPVFNQAWRDAVKDTQDKRKAGPAAKAMSAQSIKDTITTLCSDGFRDAAKIHSGDGEGISLAEADRDLYYLEMVREHEPQVYADFIATAEGIVANKEALSQ